MQPPMQAVWISSYPRSGNTWIRFLLYAYLFGDITSSWDVNVKIPPIHRPQMVDPAFPGRLLIKTHFKLTEQHPYFASTTGFIYIYRHPKDCLLSTLNYHHTGGGVVPPAEYARLFIKLAGDPMWVKEGYGTWAEHIDSWLEKPHWPHVSMKYEDMKADPHGHLKTIVAFLGEPADDARIARTIEHCSFDRLRALEAQEKESGGQSLFPGSKKTMTKGHMFMNKAQSGRTLAEIAPGLDEDFDRRFAPLLHKYGYGTTSA